MDCHFHTAVPSVAVCRDCTEPICATCRDAEGICPGCRLARRIAAANADRPSLAGAVGPSNAGPRRSSAPPPHAAPPPQVERPRHAVATVPEGALASVSVETRALLALGYPFWPLAVLALLYPKRDEVVRRQALQALGLNLGTYGLGVALATFAHVPLLGWSAWPLIPLLFPIWLVASVVYAFKVFSGDDVRVPIVSDWLDEREVEARYGVAAVRRT